MIGLDDKDYIIKLEAEVDRLQEQLSSLGRNFDLQKAEVERSHSAILALTGEVERLRKVLEWIAQEYPDQGAGIKADEALCGKESND